MRILSLALCSAVGLWFTWHSCIRQVREIKARPGYKPTVWLTSQVTTVLWYFALFVFFVGLTVNNTLFR